MKKYVKTKPLLFLFLFVVSCHGATDSFYTHYKEGDLYRLPLIPPYQLINLAGFDERQSASPIWQLLFVHGGDESVDGFNSKTLGGGTPRTWATDVNVTDSVIYGYCGKDKYGNKELWFVIIPDSKIEKVFGDDESGWKACLKQKGIENIKLFPVWSLFEAFKKSYVLPWYPQKNIYPNNKQ